MNYNFSEVTFPSSDGKSTVYAEVYTPKNRSSVGIIQISHGMIDHIGRYTELIEYFTANGYVVAGNHHLGHGKTAAHEEDLGFFSDKGGVDLLIEDLHEMNRYLRREFPTLPLIMLGHSMGSLAARAYVRENDTDLDGLILCGSPSYNPLTWLGMMMIKPIRKSLRH